MGDVPATLLIKTTDPVNFPLESVMVVMSSIFKFRVKEIVQKQNMVAVSLFYSPKTSTLKRKFGSLPVTYVRVNIKNDRELELFERAVRMYKFDLQENSDEDEEEKASTHPQKRLQQLHNIPERPMPKKKKGRNTTATDLKDIEKLQKASMVDLDETQLREFVEDFDPNNEYESQMY